MEGTEKNGFPFPGTGKEGKAIGSDIRISVRKENESHREYAYHVLKSNIMEFRMAPGCIIDECEIAGMLSVSRMPVHEAVTKLKEERLIDVIPRKESKVSKVNISFANEGLFLRSTVEPAVLRLAAGNMSPEYIRKFRENLDRQKAVVDRKTERQEFFAIDDEFHWMIYRAANKIVSLQTIRGAVAHLDRVRYLIRVMENIDLESPSYYDHEEMYHMLLFGVRPDRDVESFYRNHISRFEKYLLQVLERHREYFEL